VVMQRISWFVAMAIAMLGQSCINERGFACSSQCDCERGYFCNNRGRCIRECRSDNECPCGAFCAASCGLCIRADKAMPATCRAIGSSISDIIGACSSEASPACRPVADAGTGGGAGSAPATDAASGAAAQCAEPLPIVSCMDGFVGLPAPTPDVTTPDAAAVADASDVSSDGAHESGASDGALADSSDAVSDAEVEQ
jgi:hypothetical protein